MATRQPKPIRVFFSELSRRFYATRAYTIDEKGIVTVTGEQFDVTNDIAGLIEHHSVTFKVRVPEVIPRGTGPPDSHLPGTRRPARVQTRRMG